MHFVQEMHFSFIFHVGVVMIFVQELTEILVIRFVATKLIDGFFDRGLVLAHATRLYIRLRRTTLQVSVTHETRRVSYTSSRTSSNNNQLLTKAQNQSSAVIVGKNILQNWGFPVKPIPILTVLGSQQKLCCSVVLRYRLIYTNVDNITEKKVQHIIWSSKSK